MRHRVAGRHLSRTSAHHKAMRRNLAQSLFQYGQIETTLIKAKDVRPFVERLITLARKGTLQARQRVLALLGDRAALSKDEQERYDAMPSAQQARILTNRSGRRHRTGQVPASYNKKTYTFVAKSVVHRLFTDIAPRYKDRPGGYTRIIRLAKHRIGDNSDLAILQLVGTEEPTTGTTRKTSMPRRRKAADRVRYLEGKATKKKASGATKGSLKSEADKPDTAGEAKSE